MDLAGRKLSATLLRANQPADGEPRGTPTTFDLIGGTRVYVGNGFGDLESIAVGQTVQLNLTWATRHGPGRVIEIWLDDESRAVATARQLARHRDHVRDRGLPGWIDAVDDEKKIVTITFFDGADPQLFQELKGIDEKPHGWPFSSPKTDPNAPKGASRWPRRA